MRVIILAGGKGTRLQERTLRRPKPLLDVGGRPLLCHVMDVYDAYGFREFVVALGYKGDLIKQHFLAYHALRHDLTIALANGGVQSAAGACEDWIVHLVDTGLQTQTGGRLRRLASYIGRERFMLTYGDGVANVNVPALLDFHRRHGRLATLTAVRPTPRFGMLQLDGDQVARFQEKPADDGWINGGFFVLEPGVLDYLTGDDEAFERGPLERLAAAGQLAAYRHTGFWQCIDTLKDLRQLEALVERGELPWKLCPV